VSVVDLTTNKEITKVTVGLQPSGLAVSPDGTRLYALSQATNKVTVIQHRQQPGSGKRHGGEFSSQCGAQPQRSADLCDQLHLWDGDRAECHSGGTGGRQDDHGRHAARGDRCRQDASLVYVANGKDTVTVINTKTNAVIGTAVPIASPANTGAHAIALSGNKVLVTDYVDNSVRMLDVARVQTPQADGQPTVGTLDLNTGVVTGDLKVIDTDGDALSYTVTDAPDKGGLTVNLDGTYTYTPTSAAREAAGPSTVDQFTVRVSDTLCAYRDASVTVPVLPGLPAGVTAIAVGSHPIDMTGAGNRLFVLNSGDGSVSVIDTATNKVVNTFGGVGYSAPMVASSDGRYLYLSQYDSYNVTASVKVVDTATNSVVGTVTMPKCESECWANSAGITDIAINPDDSRVYVSELWVGDSFYAGTITMIDTTTNTVVGSTSNSQYGDFYSNIEVSPDGTRLYAASGYPYFPQMDVFDAHTLAGVGTVPLDGSSGWPRLSMGSLTFSPNGERAYARMTEIWPTYTSQTFAVIDTKPGSLTYNKQIATITVPAGAQYLKVSPDNSRAYVVHDGGKMVTVIDTATNTVIGSITSDQVGGDYAVLSNWP
jgi:YVTN family beta-propeller protein/VCBS repeat-containing protein